MQQYYTIGEVARIFDLSIDTLRFYDKEDIIKPYTVGDNQYRYYHVRQFEMLSTINLLKGLGMSLKEIRKLTRHVECVTLMSRIRHSLPSP